MVAIVLIGVKGHDTVIFLSQPVELCSLFYLIYAREISSTTEPRMYIVV